MQYRFCNIGSRCGGGTKLALDLHAVAAKAFAELEKISRDEVRQMMLRVAALGRLVVNDVWNKATNYILGARKRAAMPLQTPQRVLFG